MLTYKQILLSFALTVSTFCVVDAEELVNTDFRPRVYGTVRARGELSTESGEMRFQVRTGRVGVMGNVNPSFDYKAELDLCDRGKVIVTDVWAGVNFRHGFRVQAGQMRMPFTFGCTRGPQSYLFADRSFTDKQFIGPRNVGIKGVYRCPATPLTIEAGVFNSSAKEDHTMWQKRLAYAAKVLYKLSNLTMITGFESLAPGTARLNNFNLGANWIWHRWMVEGEYVTKHYSNTDFNPGHAFNFQANYTLPLRRTDVNSCSFQARYDGFTSDWNGTSIDEFGLPRLTNTGRYRLTAGTTLSYHKGSIWADVKLNYAYCRLHGSRHAGTENGDKLTAELVIHF